MKRQPAGLSFIAHAHPVKAMDLHAERKKAADAAWERGGFPPIVRTGTGWAYARERGR